MKTFREKSLREQANELSDYIDGLIDFVEDEKELHGISNGDLCRIEAEIDRMEAVLSYLSPSAKVKYAQPERVLYANNENEI